MIAELPHHDRLFPGTLGRRVRRRGGFTLIELLITVSIIGIMASMILFAFYAAQEQARVQKTRTLIAKLNNIIRARYETYRTRRAPIDAAMLAALPTMQDRTKARLDVLRDLMRMEMPDRWSDVYDNPVTPFLALTKITRPAASQAYFAKYQAVTGLTGAAPAGSPIWTNQYAECLYLIVMEAVAREGDTRDVFRADDVADTDGDGFPEFVDAWGRPIRFLRWAGGFQSDLQHIARVIPDTVNTPSAQVVTIIITDDTKIGRFSTDASLYIGGVTAVLGASGNEILGDRMARVTEYVYDDSGTPNDLTDDIVTITCETPGTAPPPFESNPPMAGTDTIVLMPVDPFDARGTYPIYGDPDTKIPSFALHPLVFSAGPDGEYGVLADTTAPALSYTAHKLIPFAQNSIFQMMGTQTQLPNESDGAWVDNIHNHQLNVR